MNIFLTGACGYKGTVLVPKLLAAGHQVTAFDIMWFDNHLVPAPGLTVVQGDIRDADQLDLSGLRGKFLAWRRCVWLTKQHDKGSNTSSTPRQVASMA